MILSVDRRTVTARSCMISRASLGCPLTVFWNRAGDIDASSELVSEITPAERGFSSIAAMCPKKVPAEMSTKLTSAAGEGIIHHPHHALDDEIGLAAIVAAVEDLLLRRVAAPKALLRQGLAFRRR